MIFNRVVIDPMFPPPDLSWSKRTYPNEILPEIKLSLIFDEHIDGPALEQLAKSYEKTTCMKIFDNSKNRRNRGRTN